MNQEGAGVNHAPAQGRTWYCTGTINRKDMNTSNRNENEESKNDLRRNLPV
jgi:hypothetical protein